MAYGASADLVVRIITKAEDAGKGFTTTTSKMDKFKAGLGKMAVPAAIAGAAVIKFGTDAVSSASDLQQAIGGVEAVFGKNAGTIEKWGKQAADSAGLSQTEYANMAAALGASLKNAGIPMDQVTKKTGEMISLGADLAATYGGTTADAVSALTGALRGEADPAERYGLALNATKVNGELAAKGLDKLKGAHGTAAKAATIMRMATEQAGGAIGQFKRESDSAAGSQQIATAKWENAKAKLGTALLPMVTKVTTALGKLAGWMGKNAKATQIIMGVIGGLAAAVFILIGALKAYEVVTKAIAIAQKATWLSNPIFLIVAAVIAIIVVIVLLYKKCKWFRDFVNAMWAGIKTAAKAVADFLVSVFRGAIDLVKGIWDGLKTAIKAVLDALEPLFQGVATVFKTVWRVAKAIVVGYFRAYKAVLKGIFTAIKAVFRGAVAVFKTVWRVAVAVVRGYFRVWKTAVTTVFSAIKTAIRAVASLFKTVWRGAVEAVKTVMRNFKTFLGDIWTGVKTAIGTVKTKIVNVFTTALSWITDKWDGLEDILTAPWDALKGIIDDISDAIDTMIGWISKIHFPSMPGWLSSVMPGMAPVPPAPAVTQRGLGAVVPMRRSAVGTAGAGVTINVNGALDPESVARQIQRIMAGHDRRMGIRSA